MEIKKEILPKSKVRLTIKVDSPQMRGFFAKIYNKLASTVEVKGFRPGMAPRTLTIGVIGENRLNNEIIDLALQETFSAVLKKENLTPVSQPKIDIKMLKDLTVDTAELVYEAEFDVLPTVEIGKYKDIRIGKKDKDIKADEEEIEHVLSHLQRERATFKDIERPLKEGDRAEINFDGFERGVKLENLSSQNYPAILGSKVLIPEFEKNLIGLKKDDKKEFTIEITDPKIPKNPKRVDFKVEILKTQEVILPKLDDELAKNFGKSSVEDLKKAIKDDILKQKEAAAKRETENQVLEELLKITKTEVPEGLIEQEVEREIGQMRERVSAMGMTFEQYLTNLKKSEEELKTALASQAEKTVKIGLALGEVVRLEKIDPKDKQAGKIALDRLIKYSIK